MVWFRFFVSPTNEALWAVILMPSFIIYIIPGQDNPWFRKEWCSGSLLLVTIGIPNAV